MLFYRLLLGGVFLFYEFDVGFPLFFDFSLHKFNSDDTRTGRDIKSSKG
jgi:hypothetical protein